MQSRGFIVLYTTILHVPYGNAGTISALSPSKLVLRSLRGIIVGRLAYLSVYLQQLPSKNLCTPHVS